MRKGKDDNIGAKRHRQINKANKRNGIEEGDRK